MSTSTVLKGKEHDVGRSRIQPRPPNESSPKSQRSAPLYLFFAVQGATHQKWVGSRYLGLTQFQGQESISSPFEYQLELHANTASHAAASAQASKWPALKPADSTLDWEFEFSSLLGRPATVGIATPSKEWPNTGAEPDLDLYHNQFERALEGTPSKNLSLFNGVVGSFSFAEPGVYHATLRPSLWTLTLSNHYRSFYGSISSVIADVLQAHGFTERAKGAAPVGAQYSVPLEKGLATSRVQHWLQAGESDYAFIQRLMGKANLYFYFEHSACGHTVVFSNRLTYPDLPPADPPANTTLGCRVLRYASSSLEALGLEQENVISQYKYQQELTSNQLVPSILYPQVVNETLPVCNYLSLPQDAAGVAARASTGLGNSRPFAFCKTFGFGVESSETGQTNSQTAAAAEVEEMLKNQRLMLSCSSSGLSGQSHCPAFRVGYCFGMTDGEAGNGKPQRPIQPQLINTRFVLTSVKHQASISGSYQNSFEATEASGLVTHFNAQDTEQGSILGVVVGTADGSAKYRGAGFLPKKAFAPNSADTTLEETVDHRKGVYVKLATSAPEDDAIWAGLSGGNTTIPQIGSLVTVGRARDESELPEVQQVLDSHGSSTAKPASDHGLAWSSNSHIGSNRSTTYGDSQGVHFGGHSPGAGDIDAARQLVKGAYLAPDSVFSDIKKVVTTSSPTKGLVTATSGGSNKSISKDSCFDGGGLKDVSYSQGASCSFSESDSGADGVLSRSVSRGCSWGASMSAWSRNYSISGPKAQRDSFKYDVKEFDSDVTSGSQSWVFGNTENHSINHGNVVSTDEHTGNKTSTSSMTGDQSSTSTTTGNVVSSSTMIGDTANVSETTGNVSTTQTATGDTTNTSVNNGNSTNSNTVNGNTTHTSVQTGNTTSSNTVTGDTTNTSVSNGNSTSSNTVNGNTTDTTTHTGLSVSHRIMQNETSTVTGVAQSSSSAYVATNSNSTVGTENSNRVVGASVATSITGSSNSISTVGSSSSVSVVGSSSSVSAVGSSSSVSAVGSSSSVSAVGDSASVSTVGSSSSVSAVGSDTSLRVVEASNAVSTTTLSNSISSTVTSNVVDSTATGVRAIVDNRKTAEVSDMGVDMPLLRVFL